MVSLGLVGEVFEVRTQVDRDLTTVSRVDRQLRLIKNPGRHMLPPQRVSGPLEAGDPHVPLHCWRDDSDPSGHVAADGPSL
jgi:hypothetical protein